LFSWLYYFIVYSHSIYLPFDLPPVVPQMEDLLLYSFIPE